MSTQSPELGQSKLFDLPALRLTLADRFLVPPFSVLEARAGYWRVRKQAWVNLGLAAELGREAALLYSGEQVTAKDLNFYRDKEKAKALEQLGLDSGAGRGENLLSGAALREGFGGDYDTSKGENAWGGAGTSIFDPVICELVYRWFCPEGGRVLDPFAGGSVRGIVAAHLGLDYLGVDLRPEQVAANEEQRRTIGVTLDWTTQPRWQAGDSRELGTLLGGAGYQAYDLVFTCPPYYDLEVYSDDPRDLSNADDYAAFLEAYRAIISQAVAALKPNRFAVVVVGEVRAKDGNYVGLVPDTIKAFQEAGMTFYNEGILVTSVGSLPIRTSAAFGPGRKLGKTHQNVLGFVKGDWRAAAQSCPMPQEIAVEYGGATWRADGTLSGPSGEQAAGLEPEA